jgi:hypothetical protein
VNTILGASQSLTIGDRDENVFVVAAPDQRVNWAVRGLEVGDADMWVRAGEPLDRADNAWLHEYVHTRQQFAVASDMQWLPEASASYLTTLLSYKQGRIDSEAFRKRLAAGERPIYDGVVLGNRSTWRAYPGYDKGALLLGTLDRRIRAGPRDQTLLAVLRDLNEQATPVDERAFRHRIREAGGVPVAQLSARGVLTRDNASVWDASLHHPAFEPPPPRVQATLPPAREPNSYRITGPYRVRSIDRLDTAELVPGERLMVMGTVENPGTLATSYNATLWVGGRATAAGNGTIGAGETNPIVLSHEFTDPGSYDITLGADSATVEVIEPAAASVGAVTVSERQVVAGELVTLTVITRNAASRPAVADIQVTRDGALGGTESALLAPNSTEGLAVSVRLPTAGPTNLTVNGNQSLHLNVSHAPGDPSTPETAVETAVPNSPQQAPAPNTGLPPAGEWVGIGVFVLALGGLLLALGRRRRW